MASIAGNAMKIGGGADLRAALNLSSSSQAGDTTDISALFDQLLAQNVSAQAGDPPPQENSASAQPSENSPASDKAAPYSASHQNFMQALLSTSQSSDAPANSNARPIPAEPRATGFPRIAALVADPGPAWPPSAGGAAAPMAAPPGKISDTKQMVNGTTVAQPAVSTTKTIAEILQSALAAPVRPQARAPSADEASAPAQTANAVPPRSARPDVVMDAKSFARLAQFIMPNPPGTKQALMASAAPSTLPDANSAIPVAVATSAVVKTAAPPEIVAPSLSSTPSRADAAIVIESAARPVIAAGPKSVVLPQLSMLFSPAETAKNNSVAAPSVAAPTKQSQAPIATSTQTRATTQNVPMPPVTVSDAIEGLRAALLGDVESVAPIATIPAAPKPSVAAPVATASAPQTKILVQIASPKPSDATVAPAQPTIRFIAGIDARPVAQTAQPSRFTAVIDTKNVVTSAQSVATLSDAIAKSSVPATATPVQPSTATPTPSVADPKQTIAAQQTARFSAAIDAKISTAPAPSAAVIIAAKIPVPTIVTPEQTSVEAPETPTPPVATQKQTNTTEPTVRFFAAVDAKISVAPAPSTAAITTARTPVPTAVMPKQASVEPSETPTPSFAAPKQAIAAQPIARFAAVIDTKNIAAPAQSATPAVSEKPLQAAITSTMSNVKYIILPSTQNEPVADASSNALLSTDAAPAERQPVLSFAQTRNITPEIPAQQDADAKLATPVQPATRFADVVETKNSVAAVQSVPQTVSEKPQQVPAAAPQNVKPAVVSLDTAQPSVDAKIIPQETQTDDPSLVAKVPAESARPRDAKQDTPEYQATTRDPVSDSNLETQIQSAPQPVADANAIVQPVIAPPVAAAPQPSKSAPKSETNAAARGSLAAAFAAAAAKTVSLPATLPEELRTAPVAVSGKETSGGKDDQLDKNTDGPAQTAPVKNEPAAQAPAAFDATAQPQPTDNTIQLPQTAIVLTNNSAAAAVQAPHASSNIDVSLQVGPKDHVPSTREPQVDLSALAINIAARSQGGSKHFDIRLDPAEMGRVEVRLSIDESGKATAHLSAEKPQTLELLQRDSSTLARTLKDSGLDLSQNGLNFSLKGQNQQHNGSDAQPRGTPLVVTATANPEPSLNPINMRADNVRLDIHV